MVKLLTKTKLDESIKKTEGRVHQLKIGREKIIKSLNQRATIVQGFALGIFGSLFATIVYNK